MTQKIKKWIIVTAIAGAVIVLFVMAIAIGAGQHHSPKTPQESFIEGTVRLSEIENGSWWTDGNWYCEIAREDSVLRMAGFTLHEGGFEGVLTLLNDTLARVSEGDIFAPLGSIVRLQNYVLEDDMTCQLLVAYSDSSLTEPVAALQHFDGDEEAFEQTAFHRLLAGTYTSEDGNSPQFVFYPDGTVSLTPDADPEPYSIETLYHALTDVICLPDGRHIGIALNNDYLFLFDTEWDEVEEVWISQEEVAQRLKRESSFPWIAQQLFCAPMANIMFDEWIIDASAQALTSPSVQAFSSPSAPTTSSPDPFVRLNASLMRQYVPDAK